MKVILISTYDMGRQPFGLASPAAWLRERGHEVICADLSVAVMPVAELHDAGLVAFYLPMHTATRLALKAMDRVSEIRADVPVCAYGLYAPMNEALLRRHGASTIIGGEFEQALVRLADGETVPPSSAPLDRLEFRIPDRAGLPGLGRYAKLAGGGQLRVVGSTEASRGCKHLCRHCPVVPVYKGAFRVVQYEVVLEDIRRQVAAGAQHITFGDPDFFNGPTHARRIVEALGREFTSLTYDVTIKIEHLLKHRDLLPVLRDTGCAFVTSAVESLDDAVLEKLDKGHTRRDFEETAVLFGELGMVLSPTFIAFTPWTTMASYRDLLDALRRLGLVESTSPVQLALRLLITGDSRLLELPEIAEVAGEFDPVSLAHPWRHAVTAVDELARRALHLVNVEQSAGTPRKAIYAKLCRLAQVEAPDDFDLLPRAAVHYLNEPWYC